LPRVFSTHTTKPSHYRPWLPAREYCSAHKPQPQRIPASRPKKALFETLLQRAASLLGAAAALTDISPLGVMGYRCHGHTSSAREPNSGFIYAAPVFRTLARLCGAANSRSDRKGASRTIVNERFVAYYWPAEPDGRHSNRATPTSNRGLAKRQVSGIREEPQIPSTFRWRRASR
jgi:hypothetical protein